jgi:hypothetical protein
MAFGRRIPALWVTEERTELIGADYKNLFNGYETLDFRLVEHKPLGCTVEESLADQDALPIFITKVRAHCEVWLFSRSSHLWSPTRLTIHPSTDCRRGFGR